MEYVEPPPPWEEGRQGILNALEAQMPEHTFRRPVPVVVRIVWEHDGVEQLETAARTLRRGAGRSGHQIEPPRPAERGELVTAGRPPPGPCPPLLKRDALGTDGLDQSEHLFDTGVMDRQPVEYPPDKWRGELEGLYIKHDGDIPVTVKVTWTDGTEGEVNAWTGQWTRTHVCVSRETAPPYHPFWVRASDVRRR